ncbi:MAG: hypothetical protein KGQ57_04760 [Burkholderiales bacterium]|nr:hypothetical protein [Burkholderiales bacterium]
MTTKDFKLAVFAWTPGREFSSVGWLLSPLYDVVPRPGVAFERQLHLDVGAQGKLATLDNALSYFSAFVPERAP